MQRKTVLIIGVSSFVGSNLAEFLKKDFRVVGTYRKMSIRLEGVLCVPCDVTAKEEVQLVIFAFKPDIVIYCAGLTGLVDCSKAETVADSLNTIGLFNVSEYAQRYKSQICYISSAYVFGGDNKEYRELDIPDSNTVYGKTKASAEFYIQKTSLNYLIFRTCNLYGRSINPKQLTSFEMLQKNLHENKVVNCDNHVYTGYLDIMYLALIMKMCFDKGISNRLFQVSSRDYKTFYQFTEEYCEQFSESKSLIMKSDWQFPHVVSATSTYAGGDLFYKMNVYNLESFLNVKMPSVKESLHFTFKRFHGEERSNKRTTSTDEITFI